MNSVVQYVNILAAAASLLAPPPETARDWASLVGQRFRTERDVEYKPGLKLDLYIPYNAAPGPTILYIHGGGWQTGTKEQYVLWYLPYLQLGFRVAAVQYRLSGAAPAPAAIEDCRCALRWVAQHGPRFGIDPQRIVISGGSAGGHLALLTAMLDTSFDRDCPIGGDPPRARAVINYYGATDMEELLAEGRHNLRRWFRGPGDNQELARRLSPLRYVRPGVPPVLSLHGDADNSIPYSHSVRLHQALSDVRVPNELITISGGAHGRHTWTDADTIRAQRAIEAFLRRHTLIGEIE